MYAIAVFLNRNETLKFSSALRQNGINALVVSAPKGLGSACSVSVKFYLKEINRVKYILKVGRYKTFNNFYKIITKNNGVAYEIINI